MLVVKVGGRVVEDDTARAQLIATLAALDGPCVLVHGGGNMASALTRRLGREPRMVDGRRVTGAEDLRVAVMTYAGWVNKLLVAELQAGGRAAIGLSGADGDLVRAHRRPVTAAGVDFGLVGDVDAVNAGLLRELIGLGLTPVLCALSHDGAGQLLNTNADTIATEAAKALAQAGEAVRFYGCLDKPGVLLNAGDDASVLPELTPGRYAEMRAAGQVYAGMVPKLDTAFGLLDAGVAEVRLGDVAGIGGGGTTVGK